MVGKAVHQLGGSRGHGSRRRFGSGRGLRAALVVVALAAVLPALASPDVGAADNTHGQPPLTINAGGGLVPGGTDGARLEFNTAGIPSVVAGEQMKIRGHTQMFLGTAGINLAIGSTMYGESGTSNYVHATNPALAPSFDTLTYSNLTGSASASGGSATGSGSATITYGVTVGGLLYTVERNITYTYPNDFYNQSFNVTVPAGNTLPVKLYHSIDTTPGGSDHGYGIALTAPVRQVVSLNPISHFQFGVRETPGSAPLDGAVEGPPNPIMSVTSPSVTGGDILFSVDTSDHDAGIVVQWTIGSTPGTFTRAAQIFANPQGTTLYGWFADPTPAAGPNATTLDLSVVNTSVSAATNNAGFTFLLPAGLTVGTNAPTNTCGGTLSAAPGSNLVTLSGATTVAAVSNCTITVSVDAPTPGSYLIGAPSVLASANVDNGVADSTLTVTGANQPLAWSDQTLVDPTAATPYSDAVHATGSPAPTYSVSSGSLPAGLSLDANTGAVTGTPSASAGTTSSFAITAHNGVSPDITATFALMTIQPPTAPVWTDQTLPAPDTGVAYSDAVAATAYPPATYSVTAGALPAGLLLAAGTGAVVGTPAEPAGTPYDFTITAANGVSPDITAHFTGTIGPIAPPPVPPPVPPPLPPPTPLPTPDPTPAPAPAPYTCPTEPFRVTPENQAGANIAWYVCRMHLVGGEWHGENALVLMPAGWFPCPDPPQRIWLDMRAEFGNWLLLTYCAYNPTFARTWFGTWIAFDPPARPNEYVRAAWWFSHFTNTGQWVPWPRQ